MQAVGAYLKKLRMHRNLTQQEVADGIKQLLPGKARRSTDTRTLGRWENGDNAPLSDTLFAWCRVVGADTRIVQGLMLDTHASAEQGREAAKKQLSNESLNAIPEQDLRIAQDVITRLLAERAQQSNPE